MTDTRSKSEIQRDNRDEAIRLRQREGEVTSSGPVLSDEEITEAWSEAIKDAAVASVPEVSLFARRLLAAFAERVAERLKQCRYGHDFQHTCELTAQEAASIVREAAK